MWGREKGLCGERALRVTLHASDHGFQADFTAGESDPFHHLAREVVRDGERRFWRLAVDGREEDGEERGDRGRLARVQVHVEVELPIAHLREQVDARLAFGNGELRAIERL